MKKKKNLNEEKNSSTEQGAANSASAAKQPENAVNDKERESGDSASPQQPNKKAENKEQETGVIQGMVDINIPEITIDEQIEKLSKNAKTMKLKIKEVKNENGELRILRRSNPSSLRKFASSDKDVNRMRGLKITNNTRWLARAEPILDNIQKELSVKISCRKKSLHESIKLEKARTPYFIKRNQYHIKQKLSRLFNELRTDDISQYRSFQRLAARRTKIHMEQFESEILTLINEIDSDLYHKCVGVSEYKIKFINYIRDLLK